MKTLPLKIFYLLSSPLLTAFLLAYAALFVFFATIEASHMGIAQMQARYIESWGALLHFSAFGKSLWAPIVCGKTIGAIALVNIAFSAFRFTRRNIEGFGFAMVHMALALLIVSGFLQGKWRMEGMMPLRQGEPSTQVKNISGGDFPLATLPFSVELKKFEQQNYKGSSVAKDYSSLVVFRYEDKKIEKLISMNEPASFGAWTFYQYDFSYGEGGGAISKLLAVKNPAGMLPTVSIALILSGMIITYSAKTLKKSDEKIRNIS